MEPYQLLEREFAQWNGLHPDNMVVCSSGTASLHLAFEALRLPPRSDVLCPDYAMVACPRAIVLSDLNPRFVDIDKTLCMDPNLVWGALGSHTAAVLAVHTFGRTCDMERISSVAGDRRVLVIEDIAEAHGVRPHPFSSAAVWSFYRNKIIHGEEGGAVYFPQKDNAEHARKLRNLGFDNEHDFWHLPRGHNYRLSNLHAEPIRDSLRRVEENLKLRWEIEHDYDQICPQGWKGHTRISPWVYDIRIPSLRTTELRAVVKALNADGIPAREGFKPLHLQSEYLQTHSVYAISSNNRGVDSESILAARETFYLPMYPSQPEETPARAFEVIRSVLKGYLPT